MAISAKAAKKLKEIYLDEHVCLYLRDMHVVTVDENQQEVKITIMAEGYVIDVDQDFFYLGLPDGQITKTINHEVGQMVEIQFSGGEVFDMDVPMDEDVH